MSNSPNLPPSILVIFGITGDLAKRYVLPALYHLCKDQLLPPGTKIIGISRQKLSTVDMLEKVDLCVNEVDGICDPDVIKELGTWISMFQLDPIKDQDYDNFKTYLADIEEQANCCMDRLFYLSIPPQVYSTIIAKLGRHNMHKSCEHKNAAVRLLIEKPFGNDLVSAEQLIEDTEAVFSEDQIYRIDHYLAKETAKNILKFRKHNPLFANQWNSNSIKKIHVIAREKIGIENRVNFYEQVGALRDLIQSHLLQLLSLTALDLPNQLTSDEVHAKKHDFLKSLIPPASSEEVLKRTVRGQYDSYTSEVANPNSKTETFVSLVLFSNDPDWQDCTFQLTTGKALEEKLTIIKIYFGHKNPNILSLRIQPNEGFDIDLLIEKPGFTHNLRHVKMNFSYNQTFNDSHDAYERVLFDAIRGNRLAFATKLEVLDSWRLLQPILDTWGQSSSDLEVYASGGSGPDINRLNLLSAKLKSD